MFKRISSALVTAALLTIVVNPAIAIVWSMPPCFASVESGRTLRSG
jgi:hypothetical protein